MSAASVPKKYWSYAFAVVVYLINRLPTDVLSDQSPYQKLHNVLPNYEKLRIFGCCCYPWLRPYTAHKLQDRSKACVFMGYSLTQSAYLCLDVSAGRIYTSRHVQFDEATFPFKTDPLLSVPATQQRGEEKASSTPVMVTKVHLVPPSQPPSSDPHPTVSFSSSAIPTPASSQSPGDSASQVLPSINSNSTTHATTFSSPLSDPTGQTNIPNHPNNPDQPTLTTQRPTGSTILPNQQTTITETTSTSQRPTGPTTVPTVTATTSVQQPPQNTHQMRTRAKNQISKPTKKFSLTAALAQIIAPEPATFRQAMKDALWRESMSEEITGQIEKDTWDLVPASPTQKVIGCQWIYKNKLLPKGKLGK